MLCLVLFVLQPLRQPGQIVSKATRLIRKLGSQKDLCPLLFNFH